MSYNRTAERAAILAAEANRLLEIHEAKHGRRDAQARSVNQIAHVAPVEAKPEDAERNELLEILARRLATRDQTGAGSGEGG